VNDMDREMELYKVNWYWYSIDDWSEYTYIYAWYQIINGSETNWYQRVGLES